MLSADAKYHRQASPSHARTKSCWFSLFHMWCGYIKSSMDAHEHVADMQDSCQQPAGRPASSSKRVASTSTSTQLGTEGQTHPGSPISEQLSETGGACQPQRVGLSPEGSCQLSDVRLAAFITARQDPSRQLLTPDTPAAQNPSPSAKPDSAPVVSAQAGLKMTSQCLSDYPSVNSPELELQQPGRSVSQPQVAFKLASNRVQHRGFVPGDAEPQSSPLPFAARRTLPAQGKPELGAHRTCHKNLLVSANAAASIAWSMGGLKSGPLAQAGARGQQAGIIASNAVLMLANSSGSARSVGSVGSRGSKSQCGGAAGKAHSPASQRLPSSCQRLRPLHPLSQISAGQVPLSRAMSVLDVQLGHHPDGLWGKSMPTSIGTNSCALGRA